MSVPNPFLAPDPFEQQGLDPEAAPSTLAEHLADLRAAMPRFGEPDGLAAGLLRWPWYAPVDGLDEDAQDAWLEYRRALATLRVHWNREGTKDAAEHDHWVASLEGLLKALGAAGLDDIVEALLEGAGLGLTSEHVEDVLAEAKADLMIELLLKPAEAWVEQNPQRYLVEAAHLIVIHSLGDLGRRKDDHLHHLKRILRAGGLLWLEVERPDRAAELLDELAELDPDARSIRHYGLRAHALIALSDLRKGADPLRLANSIKAIEEMVESAPYHWELRTQLSELHLQYGRAAIDNRRASDASESLVKAIAADMAWPACAAFAADLEGSMHESRLVGALADRAPGSGQASASEQLKQAIRSGFSRGEMYLSRAKAWEVFAAWPTAEAARLWAELGLPMDGGTFPDGCLAFVEVVADAPPMDEGEAPAFSPALREAVGECVPELPPEHLDAVFGPWVSWARATRRALAAPISARDLLFLHRIRTRGPVAPPLGPGPYYRPVLGFGLRESADGIVVEGVKADGPAAAAGLRDGDLILRLRGFDCPDTSRLIDALFGWSPGEPIPILVRRGKQAVPLQMSPREQREVPRLPQKDWSRRFEKLLGFRMDPQLKVLGAPRVGMLCQVKQGDVIQRVDGVPVASRAELEQVMRTVNMGQFVIFTVRRGGTSRIAKVVTLAFKGS